MREMVLDGVSGIAQGLNPTLIRIKLESLAPPALEPKKGKNAAMPKPAAGAPTTRSKEAA